VASAPRYRCSPRALRRRACTCHERLLPAHCGHKKASGNNEHKKATANNYVTPMLRRQRARRERRAPTCALTQPPLVGSMPGVARGATVGMALTRQNVPARGDWPNRGQRDWPESGSGTGRNRAAGLTGIGAAGRAIQDDRIAPCQDGYRTNPSMARWGGVTPHPPRSATGISRMQRAENAPAGPGRHGHLALAGGQDQSTAARGRYRLMAPHSHDRSAAEKDPAAGRAAGRGTSLARKTGRRAVVRRGIARRGSEKLSG